MPRHVALLLCRYAYLADVKVVLWPSVFELALAHRNITTWRTGLALIAAKTYTLAMISIPSTRARQQWARTLDEAKKAPVAITEHGRETVVLMDAELSRRALEALEDAEDAREAAEILSRIESGQERTYTMAEVAAELGLTLE